MSSQLQGHILFVTIREGNDQIPVDIKNKRERLIVRRGIPVLREGREKERQEDV